MAERPDAIDAAVELWLSWAVGVAAVWSASFEPFRRTARQSSRIGLD